MEHLTEPKCDYGQPNMYLVYLHYSGFADDIQKHFQPFKSDIPMVPAPNMIHLYTDSKKISTLEYYIYTENIASDLLRSERRDKTTKSPVSHRALTASQVQP